MRVELCCMLLCFVFFMCVVSVWYCVLYHIVCCVMFGFVVVVHCLYSCLYRVCLIYVLCFGCCCG